MDPKQNSQLDPKLQAAYDKVMGITLNQNTTASTPPTPSAPPLPPAQEATPSAADAAVAPSLPINPDALATPVSAPIPTLPTTPPSPTIPATPVSTVSSVPPVPPPSPVIPVETPSTPPMPHATVAHHSTETVHVGAGGNIVADTKGAKTKRKGISPALIVLGVFVLLIAYTLFWIKFLNVPVPYINQ